ncbi:hydroxylase [Thalassotalea litorea]|uniref:Hydroxylase n=1 Tax=Thalassotalea litorea TaxID=2020715 RepID=A0A5R9IFK6_9GAMM|nr:hydroxylase [Thalassotalea litorea]TLU61334.1 hydroxylase [Thalassotalea litorea]
MKIHYLEIVTLDVEGICAAYAAVHNVKFSASDALLGGAKTCALADGSFVGVRGPLRETETPVVRPYWLVDDIEEAVKRVTEQGAEIAVSPMEIPERGSFAIYLLGGIEHGLWQL